MKTTETQKTEARMEYEKTSGYVGAMGQTWEKIEGAELEIALNQAATTNKISRQELETLLGDGRGAAATTGKRSPNYEYDHGMEMIRAIAAPKPPPALVKCSCGCSVPRSQVMSASMGTSCPDCYDRMSD